MIPFSSNSKPNPTFQTSHIWSAKYGQHKKGTPLDTPSITEFQPQWLMKQATAGWLNTEFWGAHLIILALLP
ncbi:hypothetical protein Ahy_A04g017540 [Arachis hypogaea]|uniref:Uncharacterized protein n=1 Tax=Arachis hypogaea TaxID=3818 RepID=A0A445DBC7_ARAHY|nr:hypothetical protein Ahy_A04g017540 [Arachis hypogaea]